MDGEYTDANRERRANAIAIPRSAATIFATVVAALILGVGRVLYDQHVSHIQLTERVKHLETFGPGTGKRFTYEDGQEHARRIIRLEEWRDQHVRWGAETSGEWRSTFKEHDRRLNRLENNR